MKTNKTWLQTGWITEKWRILLLPFNMISWKKEIHLHLSQNVSEHMNGNEFVPLSNKYYDPDCTDLLSHPYNLYTYLLIHENYMMYTRQSTLNDQHQILLKTLFMKKENILHNHILFLNYKIGGKSMQLRRYPLADGSCQVHQKGAVYGKTTHLRGLIHTFFLPSAATSPHTEIKVCYMVPYKTFTLYANSCSYYSSWGRLQRPCQGENPQANRTTKKKKTRKSKKSILLSLSACITQRQPFNYIMRYLYK